MTSRRNSPPKRKRDRQPLACALFPRNFAAPAQLPLFVPLAALWAFEVAEELVGRFRAGELSLLLGFALSSLEFAPVLAASFLVLPHELAKVTVGGVAHPFHVGGLRRGRRERVRDQRAKVKARRDLLPFRRRSRHARQVDAITGGAVIVRKIVTE